MAYGRVIRDSSLRVFCEHCDEEIEGCDGEWGDWMHSATRREHCDAVCPPLAMPKLPSADRVVFH